MTIDRRAFLGQTAALLWTVSQCNLTAFAADSSAVKSGYAIFGTEIFERILKLAQKEQWHKLPVTEAMSRVAMQLKGTPYVANTLELSKDNEICSVNFSGLDCVTFFETTLDFARMLKKGGEKPQDILDQICFTRYRHGELGDYTSRLHYTSDWLFDNEAKGVVKILRDLPGAEPFRPTVNIMSTHPQSSVQLTAHPELIPKLAAFEKALNERLQAKDGLMYVPKAKLAGMQHLLKTGDIVGMCVDQPGLDIAHTGLIWCDESGVPHFMDASSKKSAMKVTIENGPISESVNLSSHWTGVVFARPQEPGN